MPDRTLSSPPASLAVALHRLEQAQYGSLHVAQAKAETALNFRRPTKAFEEALATGEWGFGCWVYRMSRRSRVAFS